MDNLQLLVESLQASFWELTEALREFPEEDFWKRPGPNLLSVGEICSHIAYWEAKSILNGRTESFLFEEAARYYSHNIGAEFCLAIDPLRAIDELTRIHSLCTTKVNESKPQLSESNPLREGWTWKQTLMYQAFHFGYHAGQIYCCRHLLGHQTVDN